VARTLERMTGDLDGLYCISGSRRRRPTKHGTLGGNASLAHFRYLVAPGMGSDRLSPSGTAKAKFFGSWNALS
jgi:hypothetical protein